uniref:Putative ovule protein n=1 Tax=Solanum chacoense TaxID=4108 RepID=A0A0V0IB54_SOLCH
MRIATLTRASLISQTIKNPTTTQELGSRMISKSKRIKVVEKKINRQTTSACQKTTHRTKKKLKLKRILPFTRQRTGWDKQRSDGFHHEELERER